jgi:hypothetical protein
MKKGKKLLLIIGAGILLLIIIPLIYDFILGYNKLYILEKGTDKPIASKHVVVVYDPYCEGGGCGWWNRRTVLYDGTTGEDGSIMVSKKYDEKLYNDYGSDGLYISYAVNILIDGYSRAYSSKGKDIDLIYFIKEKLVDQDIELGINEMVLIPEFTIRRCTGDDWDLVLQLNNINYEDRSVELVKWVGKDIALPVIIKEGESAYIPADFSDSQIILKDIDQDTVKINVIKNYTFDTWRNRQIDFGEYFTDKVNYKPDFYYVTNNLSQIAEEAGADLFYTFAGANVYFVPFTKDYKTEKIEEICGYIAYPNDECSEFSINLYEKDHKDIASDREPLYIEDEKFSCTEYDRCGGLIVPKDCL